MAFYSPSVDDKKYLETLKRTEQDGYERGKQESQKQLKDIGINYFECYEDETLEDCSDRKRQEYSILTEINRGNRNDIDALIADKLEVKGEYDKLSEQSRLLLAEQTGLTNENINLRENLQVAQQQLRKGKKVTEKVERANAKLAKKKEELKSEVKKLKEGLPELHKLLGCGYKELIIPCAKNYIEEHRSTKEKNEQLKSQLRLASDKFKCEDGETPEDCFNRKSIIDTIDLEEQQKQIDLLRARSEEYATLALKERDRYNKDIETLKKLLECKNSEEFNGEDLGDCAERKMSELHDLLEENKKLRDTNGTLTSRGYKFAPPHPPTNPPTSATSRTAKTNNKYYSANSLAGARFPPFNTRAWAGFTL